MRRYNGWHELKIHSEYDRRRTVRNQRILFCVGMLLIAVLMIWGGVSLWKHFQREEVEETMNTEVSTSVTPEPTIVPTETPTEPPIEVLVEENIECIILDAGHGGVDGGTSSEDVLEKNINFAVVMYMKELLEEAGVEVRLTRSGDDFMDVSERAEFANQNKEDVDLFVSIHCNYFEDDASVSGLEAYYYTGDDGGQACAERMIEVLKGNEDIKVRSAKHGGYYVLKYTEIPSVLVEMGFLSNQADCEKLNSAEYQKLLAEELAKAILLNLEECSEQNAEQSQALAEE